jgi:competence protein ComEC
VSDPAPEDLPPGAPVGAVLGPIPLWALAAVAGGLVGEAFGSPLGVRLGRVIGTWTGTNIDAPLAPSGWGAGAGELLGAAVGRSWQLAGALGTTLVVVAWLGRRRRRDRRRQLRPADPSDRAPPTVGVAGRFVRPVPPVWPGLTSIAAVLLVTAGGASLRVASTDLGVLPRLAGQGGSADVVGTVVHEPRPVATGWHVLLRVDEVDGSPTRERAAVTLEAAPSGSHEPASSMGAPPALGSRWRARASARPLPDGGYGRWLARQHASVVLDPVSWEQVGAPGRLASASEFVRARVRDAATRHLEQRVGGLLVGFVTGDTRLLPDEDQEAMRATGLTHLTAVSGSNVAIVIAGVLGVTATLRVGARGRWTAVALVVPWFAFVTRLEPSVQRAGTMTLVLLAASVRGMPRDARHALGTAVLLLVLVDPRLAGSLGLLLSATATAGVLVVAPRVRTRLPAWLPRRVADLASITIGAQVAVVPLLLTTFGEVTFASIPANLVAVPAAAVAAAISFVGSVVALLHPGAGGLVLAVAGPPARIVLAAAHGLSDVGGRADLARPATVLALLAACFWVLTRPRSRIATISLLCVGALVVIAAAPQVLGRLAVTDFTVTAIDVGQGDAFLVEAPGARVLIDAGEDDTAARWLREHGRSRLDLMVVTHGHLDHVGGAPEVLRRLEVDAVWYRPLPTELPEASQLLHEAATRGVPVRDVAVGDRVRLGALDIEVLGPPPGRPYRYERSELNDSSIVVRLTYEGRRALFAGDAEQAAQRDLLARPETLATELLAVPHHGGATSDPAFLLATGARVAVIGVGRDNRHGHPHPDVLAVLEELGAEVRRTDEHGTFRVAVPQRLPEPLSAPAQEPRPIAPGVAVAGWQGHSRRRGRRQRSRSRGPGCVALGGAQPLLALPSVGPTTAEGSSMVPIHRWRRSMGSASLIDGGRNQCASPVGGLLGDAPFVVGPVGTGLLASTLRPWKSRARSASPTTRTASVAASMPSTVVSNSVTAVTYRIT